MMRGTGAARLSFLLSVCLFNFHLLIFSKHNAKSFGGRKKEKKVEC